MMIHDDARQQILALFGPGTMLDYVEIDSKLRLGLELIVAVCRKLIAEGKLEIIDDSPSGEGYFPGAFVYHGSLRRKRSDCS